jgi:hypothetical protein
MLNNRMFYVAHAQTQSYIRITSYFNTNWNTFAVPLPLFAYSCLPTCSTYASYSFLMAILLSSLASTSLCPPSTRERACRERDTRTVSKYCRYFKQRKNEELQTGIPNAHQLADTSLYLAITCMLSSFMRSAESAGGVTAAIYLKPA